MKRSKIRYLAVLFLSIAVVSYATCTPSNNIYDLQMNPPKPSSQAISDSVTPFTSLTTVDLSVDPNNWVPDRLERIQQYSKIHSGRIHTNKGEQNELNKKINELKTKIEDEFEKVLGYRPKYTSRDNTVDSSVINAQFSSDEHSDESHFGMKTGLLDIDIENDINPPQRSIHTTSSKNKELIVSHKNEEKYTEQFNSDQMRQSVVNMFDNIEKTLADAEKNGNEAINVEWIRYYDEKQKLYYFYNVKTADIEWKLPSKDTIWMDWSEYERQESDNNKMNNDIEMVGLRITCIYDDTTMKYVFRDEENGNILSQKEADDSLWIKHFDKKRNKFYYENSDTKQIQDNEPNYPYLWSRSSNPSHEIMTEYM